VKKSASQGQNVSLKFWTTRSDKMKLTEDVYRQSRMVAGVCLPEGDYDAVLREALRIALGMDYDECNDYDERYARIRELMRAYVRSPEGEGEDAPTLMARLAACIADVIPAAKRPVGRLPGASEDDPS
jgi:hypothetical protein